MKFYKEVRCEPIPTYVYNHTVGMVKSGSLYLQLATKYYVMKETQRIHSEITSIVTVKFSSFLQDCDKESVNYSIIYAVQTPMSLDLMINIFLSSDYVMKIIAQFIALRMDVSLAKVVDDMTNLVNYVLSHYPTKIQKKPQKEPTTSNNKFLVEDPFTDSDFSNTSKSSAQDDSDDDWVDAKPSLEKRLQKIRPVNSIFQFSLDTRTYLPRRIEKGYTDRDARRMKQCINVAYIEMHSRLFDCSGPFIILYFLESFQASCDNNGIPVGAALCVFQYFIRDPSKSVLTAQLGRPNDRPNKYGNPTTYCQVLNHLMRIYATDDIIS